MSEEEYIPECKYCDDTECYYCGGPEADYHTMCCECECVEKKRFKEKIRSIGFGKVPGGYKDNNG